MSKQTDNTSVKLKTEIRRWVMDQVEDPVVLDLYCGKHGEMYQNIWHEADGYLGVDKNEPHDLALTVKTTAENAASKFDLSHFNIFDIDPYNSPWLVARRILHRLEPGKYGMTLTSGEHRGLSNSHSNEIIRATLGLSDFSDLRLLVRYQPLILKLMIRSLGEIEGVKLTNAILSIATRGVAYIGLVFDKVGQA